MLVWPLELSPFSLFGLQPTPSRLIIIIEPLSFYQTIWSDLTRGCEDERLIPQGHLLSFTFSVWIHCFCLACPLLACLLLSHNTNAGLHLTLCGGCSLFEQQLPIQRCLQVSFSISSPGNSSQYDLWIASIAGGDAKYQHLWIPVNRSWVINNNKPGAFALLCMEIT